MNCLEFRHLILSDPYLKSGFSQSGVESHLETCAQCTRFRQEILGLDNDIESALRVEVPEGLTARVLLNQSLSSPKQSFPTWVRYSIAASFAAALVVGSVVLTVATNTLERPDEQPIASSNPPVSADLTLDLNSFEVASSSAATINVTSSKNKLNMLKPSMQKTGMPKTMHKEMHGTFDPNADPFLVHAAHQPHEFYGSEHQPISNDDIEALMQQFQLTTSIDNVVYAAVCPFNGESAAHLVIKDGQDQYTVMLLPEKSPGKMYTVDDELWRGYVSPHPAGALAVLASVNDEAAIERIREVADKLQSAIYLSAEL